MHVTHWLPALLLLQLALLALCAFLTAWVVTRTTQRRVAVCVTERTRFLAAISHDLQTPITRMRLRAELMGDDEQRAKLQHDLDEMVVLVREGLKYARNMHGAEENARKFDLDALLDSLRCDYADTAQAVRVTGQIGRPVVGRPLAMRRIVTNLTDNALKYGRDVEVAVRIDAREEIEIRVSDRGPGIPDAELEAVFKPFYRLDNAGGRATAGTGLGLAIAQQLASSIGADLSLSNRPGGGLTARVVLQPCPPMKSAAGVAPRLGPSQNHTKAMDMVCVA